MTYVVSLQRATFGSNSLCFSLTDDLYFLQLMGLYETIGTGTHQQSPGSFKYFSLFNTLLSSQYASRFFTGLNFDIPPPELAPLVHYRLDGSDFGPDRILNSATGEWDPLSYYFLSLTSKVGKNHFLNQQ